MRKTNAQKQKEYRERKKLAEQLLMDLIEIQEGENNEPKRNEMLRNKRHKSRRI